MLFMIRTISLRRMWEHKVRTILTVVGIALGVAGYIAVEMITGTLTDSFSRMIDQVAGRVQLQIDAGEAGVEESLLEPLQNHPSLFAALPIIQTNTKSADGQSLLILAVDTLNDKAARDYEMKDSGGHEISDPLLFLNSTNAILLSRDFADRQGYKIDQTIELQTSQGKKPFVIRGLLEPEGPATAFGGNFALMDVYAAQIYFGRERKFDRIDLLLKEGKSVDEVKAELVAQFGDRYEIMRPQQRTQGVENMVTTFDMSLTVLSMVVLVMGIFIIINTVTTSVLQRRREIGIQRMVGVTRGSIWGLYALEGVLFGAFGAAIGTGAGYFMGRWAVLFFNENISSLFVLVDMSKVSFQWAMALRGALLGILVSLGASLYPAWQATRITPQEVLQFGPSLTMGKGVNLKRWLMLFVPSMIAIAYLVFAPFGYQLTGVRIMMIAILLGGISFTPMAMIALMRLVRGAASGQASTLLRLAADNILRDLGRAAMTVAAFMVGLAVMLQIYLFVTSTKTEVMEWINEALTADLTVTNSAEVATREAVPVTEELGNEMAQIPGVKSVAPLRLLYADYGEDRIAVLALDLTSHLNEARFRFVKGDPDIVLPKVVANEGVLLTQNLVQRQKMDDAKEIVLKTPTGKRAFPILGVVMDYTSEHGAVMLNRELYVEAFQDRLVDTFQIYVNPGVDVETVRDAIYANPRMQKDFSLFVLTNREFKAQVVQAMDQLFALAYSLEVLAMIIAFIGIINNLMATVVDRTREIGVIRSIGATRPQVARIFLFQAGLLAVSGALIAVITGFAMATVQMSRIYEIFAGYTVDLRFSVWQIALTMGIAVLTGIIAGVMPARRAAKLTLHEALKYD